MLLHLPVAATIGLDAGVWLAWSALVGWWAARLTPATLDRDTWLTRLRPWEADGRVYRRVGIRRWKGLLPDAGRFGGGRRKQLGHRRRDPAEWRALMAETRRAERVHWYIPVALVALVGWNSGVLLAAMIVYAVVANVPCIVTQRYNRARFSGLLARSR